MRFMIFGLLFLAGCGEVTTGNSTRATTGSDACNAAAYAGLIGQDAVTALVVPEPKREYRIGEPVTSDYNPSRVNIKSDETDIIVAIDCG
ncbi:MAG: I78 family peptidase inhibitor [Sulfitobacter sp.]